MPAIVVYFIDTSILLNLLAVPGSMDRQAEVRDQFGRLRKSGAKFVLPITTIIETGNIIAQCNGDRRSAAMRYQAALNEARKTSPPWTIRDVTWDDSFLGEFMEGAATGAELLEHLSSQTLGGGDLALLVEREQFRKTTAFQDVRVWTLDKRLAAHA